MNSINIVVGVSSTPAADAALRWALTKADKTGSAVTAVHVYDESEHADLPLEADKQVGGAGIAPSGADACQHDRRRAGFPRPVQLPCQVR